MPFSFGFGKGTSALNSDKFWSPLQLSPSVWLDASDSASVVLTSGAVSQWSDKSGNNRHATQGTAANRPTLANRYNLVLYSEQVDNAAWGKYGLTVTANATTSPIGTNTADKITESSLNPAGNLHGMYLSSSAPVIVGETYIASVYLKPNGRNVVNFYPDAISGRLGNSTVSVNISTGQFVSIGPAATAATATDVGNGWWRIEVTCVATGAAASPGVYLNNGSTTSYAPDGVSGCFVWGLQLVLQKTLPQNQYQQITTASSYDTSRIFPSYISFDGVNDSLVVSSLGVLNQPFTRIAVINPLAFNYTTSPGANTTFMNTNGENNVSDFIDASGNYTQYAGTASVNTSPATLRKPTIIISEFNGGSTYAYRNGTSYGPADPGNVSISSLVLGRHRYEEGYSNIQYAEVLVIPRILTASERQRLEGYLANKWGIQSNLPANHPYKSNKPQMEVSPNSFSGLRVWFKADAGVKDESGNKISADGTTIATWEDQSGNGFHAIQSNDANRPVYSTPANATGKDLPGINFDGTNRWLERRETLFTSAVSYFVVCKWTDTTGRYWPFDAAGYYPYHFALEQHSNLNRIGFFGANNSWVTSMTPTSGMQMFSILANTVSGATININTDVKFRRNKTTLSLSSNGQNGTTWPDYSIANARGFSIGRPTTLGALNMKGQVYEIIVYNRVLSDFERDEVENYLSRKWKI